MLFSCEERFLNIKLRRFGLEAVRACSSVRASSSFFDVGASRPKYYSCNYICVVITCSLS
jgi:hypothetical protein